MLIWQKEALLQAEMAQDHEAQDAIVHAWECGRLRWKLRPYQCAIYDATWALIERLRGKEPQPDDLRAGCVVACRKTGKSYIETVECMEFGIRYPGSIVRLGAPTAVEARDIFMAEFRRVLEDCPPHLRPEPKGIDQHWYHPNGSVLVLKGVDKNPDGLRGPSSDLNMLDEAAYIRRLLYLFESVLYPMTINTGGPTIMNSTLNKAPDNEFNDLFDKCEAKGQVVVVDVYNAGFTPAQIAAERAAVSTITWEVEYECKRKRDENVTAVPEWTPEVAAALVQPPPAGEEALRDDPALAHWTRYTGADLGTVDNTVVIDGYYDFTAATLWVTGERVLNGASVHAASLFGAYADLAREADAVRSPAPGTTRTRLADNNDPSLLQTILVNHGMLIQGVIKPSLESMMNLVRTYVREGRIRIAPECANLIACLRHASWKAAASGKGDGSFTRVLAHSALTDANGVRLGHYDALMALVYMIQFVHRDRAQNPIPQTFVTPAQVSQWGGYSQERYFKAPPSKERYTKNEVGRVVRNPLRPVWIKPERR